ncbi:MULTISPECIES: PIN domain-containing protein [Aeromonas]|uniref:PIN domain-containing protein n=1 Tax=Aeromonas TaxID=642 RepID=UPI000DB11D4D|nr:PIN domain-containing protein [Aeromonas caviae]MDH0316066.1 DUF3368 domain-containing protein [Aeromonas caviae]MDX7596190.1 PIN domain-containing protein [Aeromonas caviae]PZQ96330.1 MAG: DUF3368 domain-containing protein [Aeromonas media]
MQLLISDANILIDLEEGELLGAFFQLPYRFSIPDILYFEELEEQHSHLLGLGLTLGELTPGSMTYAMELIGQGSKTSRNDCFALALAKQEACPLLTGDSALRELAENNSVIVMGTLWAVEMLVRQRIINIETAKEAYTRMRSNGRRLPWGKAFERLDNF